MVTCSIVGVVSSVTLDQGSYLTAYSLVNRGIFNLQTLTRDFRFNGFIGGGLANDIGTQKPSSVYLYKCTILYFFLESNTIISNPGVNILTSQPCCLYKTRSIFYHRVLDCNQPSNSVIVICEDAKAGSQLWDRAWVSNKWALGSDQKENIFTS